MQDGKHFRLVRHPVMDQQLHYHPVFDEQSTPPHHFCIRLHIVVPLASVVSCWMPSIAAEQLHENISNITEIEEMVS
jgi:hypothetical protein